MKLLVVHDDHGNVISACLAQPQDGRASGPSALDGQYLAEVELTPAQATTPLETLIRRTRVTGRGRTARLTARA
jgi:hypothetical protein